MLSLPLNNLRTVLCIGAHADDIEIGCGGTLLKLLAGQPGMEVHWVVFGASGQRAAEARVSAAAFLHDAGSRHVRIEGFRDSYFPYLGGCVKEAMEKVRDTVSPDMIFTHLHDDAHQDHRLLCELTWCAFRDHLILEYEVPKYDGDLGRPNVYMPLDEATCRRKIDLVMDGFPSQRSKPWFTEDTYWALLRLRGIEAGIGVRFAEAFTARKLIVCSQGGQQWGSATRTP